MIQIGMIVFPKGLVAPQLYRVADVRGSIADLEPMTLGGVPTQTPVADLRRYRIRTTDEVAYEEQESVQIIELLNPHSDDMYTYLADTARGERKLSEGQLSVMEDSLAPDPASMLANSDFAPAPLVGARAALLDAFFAATAKSLGVLGFNGARMLPIPHQINAARYALQFGRPRFLLADEVGLGKTVEAGLIASSLRKYFPDWRTAILVPESLTAQWAFEMYGKFGKLVFALDEADFDEDMPGIILPHERAGDVADIFEPEILIVDEAHRILHSETASAAVRELSKKAKAVLLLTATPVSDDYGNLQRLLCLLDPHTFREDFTVERLRDLQSKQGSVEEFLRTLRSEEPARMLLQSKWKALGINEPAVEAGLDALTGSDDRHRLHRVASIVMDRCYPGARILRYRRKFLGQDNALPSRIVDPQEYKPTEEELAAVAIANDWLRLLADAGLARDAAAQRVATALVQAAYSTPLALGDWVAARRGTLEDHDGVTADPVRLMARHHSDFELIDEEEEILDRMDEAVAKWARATRSMDATGRPFARTPRYLKFLEFIKGVLDDEPDSHLLVFTGFECNVHPLYLLLRKALTDIAEVFEIHGGQTRTEREKNAFEYQEFPSGSVLISDELGGEGRNFQFASHVIHYDLPLAPWTIEQRIGRCDRVGREEELDVDSQVLVAKGGLDEAMFDFFAEGIGVFNESIAPVEAELDSIMVDVIASCIEEGASGVLDRIEDIASELESARERENAELLVRSAVGVEEARRVVDGLRDEPQLLALREATIRYARLFESMVDEQEDARVAITVGEFHTLHGLPGIGGEMIGYFDRRKAVRHERLDFFSPGHPLVRGLALTSLRDSPDRITIVRRKGVTKPALLCIFRLQIPEDFFLAVREGPEMLRPPVLSKIAAELPTRMIRILAPLGSGKAARTDIAPWLESDVSLHDKGTLTDLLGDDAKDLIAEAIDAASETLREISEDLLALAEEELADLLDELYARLGFSPAEAKSKGEALLATLMEYFGDLDSAVVLLPGK